MTGKIPDLSALAALRTLYLHNNRLSGPIPALSNLRNLQILYLYNNQLSGPIPASLSNLTGLYYLSLSNNRLSGPIPDLRTLTNLTWLYLHNNRLSGSFPALSSTRLTQLHLSNNQLSGPIPSTLNTLTGLVTLNLYNNRLSDPIPTDWSGLTALRNLYLNNNRLSGPIPASLSGLTNLVHLRLNNNQLSDPIPTWSASAALQTLDLSNNRLSGAIPTGVNTYLTALTTLRLQNNQLSGAFPTLSSLSSLQILNLSNNNFTAGTLPAWVNDDLTSLTQLRLASTNLNGAFPDLRDLTNLTVLDLSDNAFDPAGVIPTWVNDLTDLTELRLGNTNRNGDFPDLSNLTLLKILDLSSNALTGFIPAYLSNFPLEELYLNDNQLSGSLPAGLRTVGVLRLEGNTVNFGSFGSSSAITITTLADTLTDAFATFDPSSANACGAVVDIAEFPAKPTLREALIYANSTPGADTITFAPYLRGRTLTLQDGLDSGADPDPLPWLCGANLTLDGDVNEDGTPDITLAYTGSSTTTDGLVITASNITVNGFRLSVPDIGIHVPSLGSVRTTQITNNTITDGRYGIRVQAGERSTAGSLSNTTIRDNTITGTDVAGIGVVTEGAGSTLTATTIEQNEVYANAGDGIAAWSEAVNTTLVHSLNNLTIRDNHIHDHPTGSGITVTGGFNGGNYNRVTATLTGNAIWRSGSDEAGIALTGGRTNANDNTVTVTLTNNLVARNAELSSGSAGHGLALWAAAADPAGSTSSANTLTVSGQNNIIALTRNTVDTSHYDILREQGNDPPTRTGNTLTDSLAGTIFASKNIETPGDLSTTTETASGRGFDTFVTLPDPPELPALPEVNDFTMRPVLAEDVPSAGPPLNTEFSAGKHVFDITVSLMGADVTTRLTTPVRVCLPLPTDVLASQAYVLRYNAATRTWERLTTGRTVSNSQVCVNVFQFSYFTVGKDTRSSGGGGGGEEPAVLHSAFESPGAGATVSGVAVLRGWSFTDLAGVDIAEIALSIDGSAAATIPCCSERPDVAAAFPALPAANTQTSGWGMIYNWGNLAAGPHTLQGVVTSTDGERWTSDTRSVTVLTPGNIPFADRFSMADAEARLAGGQVVLDGVVIRDKATQAEQPIEARYAWQTAAQGLRLVATTPLASASAGPVGARVSRLLAGLTAWGRHWLSPAGVHANEGVTAAYEAPTDMSVGAGVGVLRGWAFATDGSAIEAVRLSIDDEAQGSLPCCSERADVAAAHPDEAAARLSGWGGVFNYGNLAAGEHTIAVEIETAAGGTYRQAHTVTTVQLGGYAFVNQFGLGQAEVALDGEEIVLSGVVVRDAASQQTQTVRVWLRWSAATQGLVIVDSEIMP